MRRVHSRGLVAFRKRNYSLSRLMDPAHSLYQEAEETRRWRWSILHIPGRSHLEWRIVYLHVCKLWVSTAEGFKSGQWRRRDEISSHPRVNEDKLQSCCTEFCQIVPTIPSWVHLSALGRNSQHSQLAQKPVGVWEVSLCRCVKGAEQTSENNRKWREYRNPTKTSQSACDNRVVSPQL